MDLNECRQKIDEIDKQIVELFQDRMQVSVEVANNKRKTGKKIYDKEREVQILEKLGNMAKDDFNRQGVQELYTQIMSISRKLQYGLLDQKEEYAFQKVKKLNLTGKKVVFYGEHGSYTEQAMAEFFGTVPDSYSAKTFKTVMEEVQSGKAEYGVLPIENSSTGGIHDVFDLLTSYENYIVGEHEIKVEQCLLGLPGAKIENLKKVFSHDQGLLQCADFLEQYPQMEQIPYMSTAISARKVKEDNLPEQAAIASRRAAECYGLSILKENINYETTNTTRFIIVSRKREFLEDSNKVSLYFKLPHECGSLYNAMSHFIFNNLNLTKIESRPVEGEKWKYRFFVEIEGNLEQPGVKNALRGMKEETSDCHILGNYKTL